MATSQVNIRNDKGDFVIFQPNDGANHDVRLTVNGVPLECSLKQLTDLICPLLASVGWSIRGPQGVGNSAD
jgi:hypothetical protein